MLSLWPGGGRVSLHICKFLKHILYLISVVTGGIYESFYANAVWRYNPAPLGKIHCWDKNVHLVLLALLRSRWLKNLQFNKDFCERKSVRRTEERKRFSYVWDWHCRRRSNKWMALSRWFPVWRQATPTCHSQMSASGRWLSTWSSANICFSISKPD